MSIQKMSLEEFEARFSIPALPRTELVYHGRDICRYNYEVNCPEEKQTNCRKCGWNPAVDRMRKAKTRERMAEDA